MAKLDPKTRLMIPVVACIAVIVAVSVTAVNQIINRLAVVRDAAVLSSADSLMWRVTIAGVVLGVLLAALVFVVTQRLQEGLAMSQSRLEHEATHDLLTGLANRRVFAEKVNRVLCGHRQTDRICAVLFLDFDRFKLINDSLGHEVGDLLLQSISKRLIDSIRPSDVLSKDVPQHTTARLGGDEFCILLEDLRSALDALRVAERLLRVLVKPHHIRGQEVHSTASIGITTSDLGYESADEMIRDADTAMYRAKSAGKARCVMFDRQMHDEAVARLALESEMPRAIQNSEFCLYYQPIVSMEDGSIVGLEALCRWEHPRLGIVAPTDFIPVAEETGHIVALGNWVLEEAIATLKCWQRRFPEHANLCVSVNVSRKQLTWPDLVPTIRDLLAKNAVAPDRLIVEITESTIMQDPHRSLDVLRQMRDLGVRLEVDDFGTGYSSLSCLHSFPLNGLKIDRAFVSHVAERRDFAAVVEAILSLARNLNIHVTAEGIETQPQMAMLQSMGCHHAQGYLFGRPMSVTQTEQFLREHHQFILVAA